MLKRLDVQIPLFISLILVAMIAVYGWWIGNRQASTYIQSLSDNLRVLSRSQADDAAHFLVIQEYAGLEEHMLEAARLPEIAAIQVCEPDGRLLCNIERTGLGELPQLNYRVRQIPVPAGSVDLLQREGGLLVSWSPIVAGKQLGWLKMSLSLHTAGELQRTAWHNTLKIGGLWVAVGIVLVILVLRRPLLAIRELSAFAHDLQSRKGGWVQVPGGNYEIDMLADALNHSSVELQAAEQRLVAERERLSVTLQSIADGVIATDTKHRVVLVNHVAERLTGWREAEAQGQPLDQVFRLLPGEVLQEDQNSLQGVLADRRTIELAGELHLVSRDGGERLVSVSGAPIIESGGGLGGMVLVVRDITEQVEMEAERRKLQEQLIQSQKMESIGQLAGGVAHDFNNILTAITGYGEMLRARVAQDEKLSAFADQILTSAVRAANLTRALLAFSRKQSIELKHEDINAIVTGMQKLLGRLIGEDIRFTVRPAASELPVMVDAGQLEQVLMNLATNARDAMPDGGTLTIETDEVFVDELYSSSISGGATGRFALITISDSGAGMDQETCGRIFEPFFTTKAVGKGTGLGLSIVYGIIRQHNGFITVYSEKGLGTTFKIYLPITDAAIEAATREAAPAAGCGSETILLAEDDNDVRGILALTLEDAGYRVVEAASGDEAVARYDERHAGIDLLLMDVIMPGMNGKEAYGRICERHPAPPIIFMSGYTADIIHHKGIADDSINFLHKPVTKAQLLGKVRQVLDGAGAAPAG